MSPILPMALLKRTELTISRLCPFNLLFASWTKFAICTMDSSALLGVIKKMFIYKVCFGDVPRWNFKSIALSDFWRPALRKTSFWLSLS